MTVSPENDSTVVILRSKATKDLIISFLFTSFRVRMSPLYKEKTP
jgi:hypothetical protein